MPNFVVTKKQQWLQRVIVEDAADEKEALEKASNDDCIITEDPKFDADIASSTWKVEEVQ